MKLPLRTEQKRGKNVATGVATTAPGDSKSLIRRVGGVVTQRIAKTARVKSNQTVRFAKRQERIGNVA